MRFSFCDITAFVKSARRASAMLGIIALMFAVQPVHAADPGATATSEDARRQETISAYEAAVKNGVAGPAKVPLKDQADLELPVGMIYVHPADGQRVLRALGNKPGDLEGLVVSAKPTLDWFVVVRFIADGYVKDDDAKNWNSDDLLTNLRDGTEETNKDRVTRGFPEIELVGWVEKPTYDPKSHRLVWSIENKLKNEPADATRNINYNTYALGRKGYFSLNLVTGKSLIDANKSIATTLLAGLNYRPGNRYEDFNESTDHIAEYGLAGLIGLVAVKKLGLIAIATAFVLKFAKLGLIAIAGIGVAMKRFFKRGAKVETE